MCPSLVTQPSCKNRSLKLLGKPSYWDNVLGAGYQSILVDANGKLPPKVEAFMGKHKDSIGPYMAAGVQAFLQGHAAVFIYAAGLAKAGDPRSGEGQGRAGIHPGD